MGNNTINAILEKYEAKQENLLPILHDINDQLGFIGQDATQKVADFLNISATAVYGTTSFYSFFNLKEKGKYVIRVCQNISCNIAGKKDIVKTLESETGIKMGETSEDKKYTLEFTNCMGMCDKGPAMLINKEMHTSLNPSKVKDIITALI